MERGHLTRRWSRPPNRRSSWWLFPLCVVSVIVGYVVSPGGGSSPIRLAGSRSPTPAKHPPTPHKAPTAAHRPWRTASLLSPTKPCQANRTADSHPTILPDMTWLLYRTRRRLRDRPHHAPSAIAPPAPFALPSRPSPTLRPSAPPLTAPPYPFSPIRAIMYSIIIS